MLCGLVFFLPVAPPETKEQAPSTPGPSSRGQLSVRLLRTGLSDVASRGPGPTITEQCARIIFYHLEENYTNTLHNIPGFYSFLPVSYIPTLYLLGGQSVSSSKKTPGHDTSTHLTFVQSLQLPNFGNDELTCGLCCFAPLHQGVSCAGQSVQTLQLIQLIDK